MRESRPATSGRQRQPPHAQLLLPLKKNSRRSPFLRTRQQHLRHCWGIEAKNEQLLDDVLPPRVPDEHVWLPQLQSQLSDAPPTQPDRFPETVAALT